MDITITPHKLHGRVNIIPSKSQAHRLLICAALSDGVTEIICPETSRDMDTTAECLNSLGARIVYRDHAYLVQPISAKPSHADLYCHDSGSTLRFLLPIAGALGIDTVFHLEGRLGQRPLSPLWEEMERMGCQLSRPSPDTIRCCGKLSPGTYHISGNVSSQFITGLLLASSQMDGHSCIDVIGTLESAPYVEITLSVMRAFGMLSASLSDLSGTALHSPGRICVEGDWSNGAFFLAANVLGNEIDIAGLDNQSVQGDRAAAELLPDLTKTFLTIDAGDIPDLVPILAVTAASFHGARFTRIQRLRLKESDRVASVIALITSLGGKAEATEDAMVIHGTGLIGGTVDAGNDHRIAMAASIAATVCTDPVTILGAECTEKSYPQFFREYVKSGGIYEQHIRN